MSGGQGTGLKDAPEVVEGQPLPERGDSFVIDIICIQIVTKSTFFK